MATTSAFASYNTSYTNRVPYITAQEYQSAPTAMDTANLVAGGQASAQLTALNETISRASSWIDQHCMGAWGTLAATVEVENARVWGSYRNSLIIHPKYWPLLEVSTFSYTSIHGGLASGSNAASITPAGNITVYPQQFEVAPQGIIGWGLNSPGGIVKGVEYDCQWQYTNGYPVSTLSASVAAGATSFTPVSAMGIYPGSTLSFYDEPYNEQVQVSSVDVADTSPVLITSGFQYAHASGVMVTNLPPAVKQAAILLTTALIKQRGSGALEVADMGVISHMTSGMPQGAHADVGLAAELLDPFVQHYVGY